MFRLTGLTAAVVAFGLIVSAPVAQAGTWEDGVKAFARKEYAAAAKLFRPLAEKGSAVAQYRIALMHKMGLGVSKDRKQAQKWSRLAAKQGNADAQVLLGSLYYKGEGGESDDIAKAYMWYDIAATQGNDEAKKELAAVSSQLSSLQIAEARAKAQKCASSGYQQCD
ncbi:MAG: tetratricopeptide repeat protein [Afipia sp.]|nr:tetratricopeptide repeat protein [Afipia sp.]